MDKTASQAVLTIEVPRDQVDVPKENVDEALRRIFSKEMRGRLVRLAYRFLWNHADAEDVVQESLARAQEQLPRLRDRDKAWSWLCRIVVHGCHEHGRRKQRHERHKEAIQTESTRRECESIALGATETKQLVRELLSQIPQRQREVMVLRHMEGMSCDEVAAVLEIAAATVRVHAKAARENLQRLMHERTTQQSSDGRATTRHAR